MTPEQSRQKRIEASRRWRLANPEKHLEAVRNYQRRNREKTLQQKREWYYKNKAHCNLKSKLWRRRHPERVSQKNRHSSLERNYGITEHEYQEMFYKQQGLCAICSNPPGIKKLCVDHRHSDGAIRGLLCHNCNFVIGNAKDSLAILGSAIEYLEKYR